MIVKKVKNKNTTKPKARQIADLVDYIRRPQNVNPAEKIEYSGDRNFLAGDHAGQRLEMIALAEDAPRSRMPVSHFVFSWREQEQPTAGQVDELADIFLREMGLEGCQCVYGLHNNTANYHLHIAVNRMHPVTMKVIDPHRGFDIEAAHRILALVEHKQGWTPEAGARYAVNEQGEVVRRKARTGVKPKAEALDFEHATGEKSAQRIAQERGHAIMLNAQSWPELHNNLAAVGLRFEKKGSGAILFVGEIAVKASSVDRAFSMGKLFKRLGEFMPGDYPEEKARLEPEPVSSINLEEWRQYQEEMATRPVSSIVMEDIRVSIMRARHQKERATLHSRLLPFVPHPPLGAPSGPLRKCPRCLLNVARHLLKLQQREEKRRLRRKIGKRPAARPRFEDWLRAQGQRYKADRWRYHKALERIPEAFRDQPGVTATPKREPLVSYAAHKRAMLKAVPDAEPDRLNAYIALQMRTEGFSREVVEETILRCAPQDVRKDAWEGGPEQPERDWRRYAERMAAYAFGVAGDVKMAQGDAARARHRLEQEKREEETPVQAPRMRMR